MILVKDTDNYVSTYKSIEEAEGHLEAIDIENNEYEACDENGNIYISRY